MNGITGQMLSLISYGNYYLHTGNLPVYYPQNLTFQFCNKIDFLHLPQSEKGSVQEVLVAADPNEWFNLLLKDGCKVLKAYYYPSEGNPDGVPDHQLAGMVGGGGTWLIEAIYPTWSDFWASRWEVTRQDDPERRIWSVSYGRTIQHTETVDFCPDVQQVHAGLREILVDVHDFALKLELSNWVNVFNKALQILDGETVAQNLFGSQINENLYTESSLRLIYAAMSSDVFGGMGSWNDLGFDEAEEAKQYQELSFYLYDWMNRALLSGINSVQY